MLHGMYKVEFWSNQNMFGIGLVTIKDGVINGGDTNYLYQGHFDYYENEIKASVEVKHYQGEMNSILGPLRSFTLTLSGKVAGDMFELTGGIAGMGTTSMTILGKKVAELLE